MEPFKKCKLHSPERFVKIGNGIEPPSIKKIPRSELGIPEDAFVVCVVSRALPEKGWKEAIEIVNITRKSTNIDIHLLLVGNGPVYDELSRDASLPDHVHLLGFKDNPVDYFAMSDLGLLPSRYTAESFPLCIIECFFAGKPVIATDVGEVQNMLSLDGKQAGETFSLKRGQIPVNEVANLLSKLLKDKTAYQQARDLAVRISRKFQISKVAHKYLDIFLSNTDSNIVTYASRKKNKIPSLSKQANELRKTGLFDAEFYKKYYTDISKLKDPLKHYVKHGFYEGRMPNEWFDASYVYEIYPEFKQEGLNPLWYYAKYFSEQKDFKTHSEMYRKGKCPVCQNETIFLAHVDTNDTYNHLRCFVCNSAPRDRAIAIVLDENYPGWRGKKNVHETSPSNDCLKINAGEYSASQFYPEKELGTIVDKYRNENIEKLTFADNTFDFIVAVDVVEHVFHPNKMVQEMLRCVKPGGAAIFTTVPVYNLDNCRPRAILNEKTGEITELLPPIYHGNPVADGALMTWDFGKDFNKKIEEWSHAKLTYWSQLDESHGIVKGGIPHIYLIKKPEEKDIPVLTKKSFYETNYYKQFTDDLKFHKERKGFCPVCKQEVLFSSKHKWLRDYYKCSSCQSTPRNRHIQHVLHNLIPGWEDLQIHESSPCNDLIKQSAKDYTASQYYQNETLGQFVGEFRNENIENLTFADNSFDLFLTQDVLEHVFNPAKAIKEMLRVVKTGGWVIFSVPIFHGNKTIKRARLNANGNIEYLEDAVYHGNPVDSSGALAVWDYGDDFTTMLGKWTKDCKMKAFTEPIPDMGVEGALIGVFALQKETALSSQVMRISLPKENTKNKKIYMHIGMGKTGTTALQYFFHENANILKKNGILYPSAGKLSVAHHLFAASQRKTRPFWLPADLSTPTGYLEEMLKEADKLSLSNILISSEILFFIDKESIPVLREILRDIELKIICYIRRIDSFLSASIQQSIKAMGGKVGFGQYEKGIKNPIIKNQLEKVSDYFQAWLNVFPKETFIIRPYEKQQFEGGNIFNDFLKILGIRPTNDFILPKTNYNPRLSCNALEFKRLLNQIFQATPDKTSAFVQPLLDFSAKTDSSTLATFSSNNFLSPAKRLEVIKKNADFYEHIACEYLGRKDGQLFFAPLPDLSDPWTEYQELDNNTICEIIEFIADYDYDLIDLIAEGINKGLNSGQKKIRNTAKRLSIAFNGMFSNQSDIAIQNIKPNF